VVEVARVFLFSLSAFTRAVIFRGKKREARARTVVASCGRGGPSAEGGRATTGDAGTKKQDRRMSLSKERECLLRTFSVGLFRCVL
jgi:hypothetical protein